MATTRIQVSLDDADLDIIDAAAEAASESRSEYLRRSALARAGEGTGALTDAQRAEVEEICGQLLQKP